MRPAELHQILIDAELVEVYNFKSEPRASQLDLIQVWRLWCDLISTVSSRFWTIGASEPWPKTHSIIIIYTTAASSILSGSLLSSHFLNHLANSV